MTKISFILIIIGIIIITKILIKLELVLNHSPPLETKLILTSNTFSYTPPQACLYISIKPSLLIISSNFGLNSPFVNTSATC